jgi:hypothetical protein
MAVLAHHAHVGIGVQVLAVLELLLSGLATVLRVAPVEERPHVKREYLRMLRQYRDAMKRREWFPGDDAHLDEINGRLKRLGVPCVFRLDTPRALRLALHDGGDVVLSAEQALDLEQALFECRALMIDPLSVDGGDRDAEREW